MLYTPKRNYQQPDGYDSFRIRTWSAGLRAPVAEAPPIRVLLRELRHHAGLTQATLAQRLGCSTKTVTHIEGGTRRPAVDVIDKWAVACGRRFVVDFPLAGEPLTDGARLVGASLGIRRVIDELLVVPTPSDAAMRALELYVAAWREQVAGTPTKRT